MIKSLKNSKTSRHILCMYIKVSDATLETLKSDGCIPIQVANIDSPYHDHDPRWKGTMSKLNAWNLDEYHKLIYLDSDCLIVENIDDLFSRPELSATLDPYVDFFNTGVMVIKPSKKTFQDMMIKMGKIESYDGYDQGFLNSYFKAKWHPLPFEYNADQTILSVSKVIRRYKVIHFSLHPKPWETKNPRYVSDKQRVLHEKWRQI